MTVLGPKVLNCELCKHDLRLKEIKRALAFTKGVAKEVWRRSDNTVVENHVIAGENGRRYLRVGGDLSIMPVYCSTVSPCSSYVDLWSSAMLQNPFEVDWDKFDQHDNWDFHYLKVVSETLEQQIDFWKHDAVTYNLPAFKAVEAFKHSIDVLHFYVTKV